jgi:hypothetical protein
MATDQRNFAFMNFSFSFLVFSTFSEQKFTFIFPRPRVQIRKQTDYCRKCLLLSVSLPVYICLLPHGKAGLFHALSSSLFTNPASIRRYMIGTSESSVKCNYSPATCRQEFGLLFQMGISLYACVYFILVEKIKGIKSLSRSMSGMLDAY